MSGKSLLVAKSIVLDPGNGNNMVLPLTDLSRRTSTPFSVMALGIFVLPPVRKVATTGTSKGSLRKQWSWSYGNQLKLNYLVLYC